MASVLSQLLRRPPGSGWIVLSGGSPIDEHVERALALVEHAGTAVAVVPTAEYLPLAEEALDPWVAFTGWNAKAVNCGFPDIVEDAVS
jgi:hypothetical protein